MRPFPQQFMRPVAFFPAILALAMAVSAPAQSPSLSAGNTAPRDGKANKSFAKAAKELDDHKYLLALGDFRKADQLDGGHCVACELHAYEAAKQLGDFSVAHEQAALLLTNVTTPEDKAQVHFLIGDVCLAEGGNRIFEKPFHDAETEFQAALELQPAKPNCIYGDGVALAHLHQYDKARERFQQYIQLSSPTDLQLPRARLFAKDPELARKRVVPSFHVVSLDGKPIAMESFAGKVVLIDFWATWCGPCMQYLPHLRQIAKQFEGQPLVVLSISLDADEPTWKAAVAKNEMTWLQYRDGGFDGPMATSFNVKAIPTTFTIDAYGFVQDRQVGDGDIETKLKQLLAQASELNSRKSASTVASTVTPGKP